MNNKLQRFSIVWVTMVNPICVFAFIYMMRKGELYGGWAPVPAMISGIVTVICGVLLLKNR